MTEPVHWLLPDHLFDGQSLRDGIAVQVSGGVVQALLAVADLPPHTPLQRITGVLTPGYIDLQVNGGGGVLFNNQPTAHTLHTMRSALHRFGSVGILPTVITDAPHVLAAAIDAVMATAGTPGLLGLHIEGPHIDPARRGTHAAHFIRPLDATTLALVDRVCRAGLTVMITLAPEGVAPGQVRALAAMGAIVSIGHSDATAESVQPLLDEGAQCFTHLFNAMSPMLNRAPGVTGAAINSAAYCGFICDGHHVADAMLALAIRARPVQGRMFLVSDCMATVGGGDSFSLYGQDIRLVDGRLVNAEGSLAGAHVTMAAAVARLIRQVGIAPAEALRMATTIPAQVIGQPALGQLVGRKITDLLVLGADWLPREAALSDKGPGVV
jgi:N-acetylglucosamine-6-phosphate deacetylase